MRNVGLNLQTLVAAFLLAAIQTIRIEGADMGPNELGIGGVGGVYLLAEPGKLTVQVWKQDLNRHDKQTNLRAILLSQDRKPVGEAVIVDDGLRNGDGPGHNSLQGASRSLIISARRMVMNQKLKASTTTCSKGFSNIK